MKSRLTPNSAFKSDAPGSPKVAEYAEEMRLLFLAAAHAHPLCAFRMLGWKDNEVIEALFKIERHERIREVRNDCIVTNLRAISRFGFEYEVPPELLHAPRPRRRPNDH